MNSNIRGKLIAIIGDEVRSRDVSCQINVSESDSQSDGPMAMPMEIIKTEIVCILVECYRLYLGHSKLTFKVIVIYGQTNSTSNTQLSNLLINYAVN